MKQKMQQWLVRPQGKLGPLGLVVLLVTASLVTPLSLDMYTPAVPHMTEAFDTTAGTVNLTLVGYFLFFAVGLLVFGPLSDRYGRRPVLLAGVVTYTSASGLCALALDIEMLIVFRVVQALGAGAVSAVATAVVKDAFKAEKREAILSIVQVMFVVGPVLSPVVGALILQVFDWRMTFCALGAVGLYNLPFMAYIAVGSYVYISFFGLSELEYSVFFAVAALLTAAGPFIWLKASRYVSARRFTGILLVAAALSGVAMLLAGELSPVLFCLTFLVFALTEACIRPYSTNILLSQQEGDTGAASSLINFAHTAIGCVGMLLAVLPWSSYVQGIGVLIVASMAFAGIGWIALLKSRIPLAGIKGASPSGQAAPLARDGRPGQGAVDASSRAKGSAR